MKKIEKNINVELKKVVKETPEERAERLRYINCTRTQVIPNKKKMTRSQIKAKFMKNQEW